MTNLISPFYHFTTIGLERHWNLDPGKRLTEYDKAVLYGRPLFELIRQQLHSQRTRDGSSSYDEFYFQNGSSSCGCVLLLLGLESSKDRIYERVGEVPLLRD